MVNITAKKNSYQRKQWIVYWLGFSLKVQFNVKKGIGV